MPSPSNPVVARLSRSGHEESVHRGAWVVVTTDGHVLEGAGEPGQQVFARSSTKSIQTLPLVESGAADTFGLTDAEIAVTIASHNGEDIHVDAVRSLLAKTGLDEGHLRCGPQRPAGAGDDAAARRVSNTCSGKHAGFLACAVHLGDAPEAYLDPASRVQQAVRRALIEISGVQPDAVNTAIDGCSAPSFRLPLEDLATAIARVANPDMLDVPWATACHRILDAARTHPEQVGGTSTPRLDTDLIEVTNGRLFAKSGAEGVQVVGVSGSAVGFAAKIDDGSKRSMHPLTLEVLSRLGLITADELTALERWTDPVRRNLAGLEVGHHELCEDTLPSRR